MSTVESTADKPCVLGFAMKNTMRRNVLCPRCDNMLVLIDGLLECPNCGLNLNLGGSHARADPGDVRGAEMHVERPIPHGVYVEVRQRYSGRISHG